MVLVNEHIQGERAYHTQPPSVATNCQLNKLFELGAPKTLAVRESCVTGPEYFFDNVFNEVKGTHLVGCDGILIA